MYYSLFHISVNIVIWWIIFTFFLAKSVHFKQNRAFLLAGTILSVLVVFIPFSNLIASGKIMHGIQLYPVVLASELIQSNLTGHVEMMRIYNITYQLISLLLLIVFIGRLALLLNLYLKNKHESFEDYTIVYLKQNISPFSFFNIVFIGAETGKMNLDMILAHELTHVRQKHSFDIILIELLCILLWFNPVIWLYRKSIRENHEYLADEGALFVNDDVIRYKSLLIDHLVGLQSFTLSSSLRYSLTQKRFNMIHKMKRSKSRITRYLFFSVLSLFLMTTYSFNTVVSNEFQLKDTVYNEVDVMPEFKGGHEALIQYMINNVTYPEVAKKLKVTGVVYVSFVINKKGSVKEVSLAKGISSDYKQDPENSGKFDAAVSIEKEAIRVIQTMPDWLPGKKDGKVVSVKFTLPVSFKLS